MMRPAHVARAVRDELLLPALHWLLPWSLVRRLFPRWPETLHGQVAHWRRYLRANRTPEQQAFGRWNLAALLGCERCRLREPSSYRSWLCDDCEAAVDAGRDVPRGTCAWCARGVSLPAPGETVGGDPICEPCLPAFDRPAAGVLRG